MSIQFGAVKFVHGNSSNVKAYLDSEQEASNLTARSDLEEAGISISGDDRFEFFTQQGIPVSDDVKEVMNKPLAEAQQELAANPDKYAEFVNALTDMASDVWGFIDKVYDFANAHKDAGKPVENINV